MVDPLNDTQYTCEILDGGKEPIVSEPSERNANLRRLSAFFANRYHAIFYIVSIASRR
jgi:hypothetical protein